MKESSSGIVVASRPGFFARMQLRAPVFERLRRSGRPVVVLWPREEQEQLQAELDSPAVFLERLYVRRETSYTGGVLEHILQQIRTYTLPRGLSSAAVEQKLERQRRTWPRWRRSTKGLWLIVFTGVRLARRYAGVRALLRKLEERVSRTTYYQQLFERYQIGVVVTATPGYAPWHEDAYVIREARRAGIPTVCVVLSWDNTSSKGLLGAVPDYCLVWTEEMKKELVVFHDVDPARIYVTGTPLFDPYVQARDVDHKAALVEKFGLDPARKIILIGTKSPRNYVYNAQIIDILVRALREDRFSTPVQFIIRPHPINFFKGKPHPDLVEMRRLAEDTPHIHFSIPEQCAEDTMDLPWSEVQEMVRLIGGADVVVSMFSTMQLEAALYDKPVINVAFDPGPVAVNDKSLTEDEAQFHNARVVATDGVRLAHSPEDLIACINRYLDDPSLEHVGRKRIRQQECGPLDAGAAERIARFILAVAEDGAPPSDAAASRPPAREQAIQEAA